MNKKVTLIIIGGILISVSLVYLVIDYLENEQQNKDAHNNRFVKNCVPGGPDKIIPSILIENKTHAFNLGSCIWELKN